MNVRTRVYGWFCVLALMAGASTIFSAIAQGQTRSAQVHTVVIHNFAFRPAELTVNAGDTVVWKNTDVVSHTVTATDGSFDSDEIKPGKSWKMIAKKPGAFPYACSPHPNMRGKLTVK